MYVYCNFLLLTSKDKLFGHPTFLGWRHHCVKWRTLNLKLYSYTSLKMTLNQYTLSSPSFPCSAIYTYIIIMIIYIITFK